MRAPKRRLVRRRAEVEAAKAAHSLRQFSPILGEIIRKVARLRPRADGGEQRCSTPREIRRKSRAFPVAVSPDCVTGKEAKVPPATPVAATGSAGDPPLCRPFTSTRERQRGDIPCGTSRESRRSLGPACTDRSPTLAPLHSDRRDDSFSCRSRRGPLWMTIDSNFRRERLTC